MFGVIRNRMNSCRRTCLLYEVVPMIVAVGVLACCAGPEVKDDNGGLDPAVLHIPGDGVGAGASTGEVKASASGEVKADKEE
jgi:hypothetical protein